MTDTVRNDLTKRDFIKLGAAGLGGLGLLFFKPTRLTENLQENWTMPVEFRFGDHNLHAEDVDPNRYALIMGETDITDLWYWRNEEGDPYPEGDWLTSNLKRVADAVKNQGFGSSDRDLINHCRLMGVSRKVGIGLGATDSRSVQSIDYEARRDLFFQEQGISGTRNARLAEAVGVASVPLFINTLALAAKKLNILDKTNKDPNTYVGNIEKTVLQNAKAETFFLWFTLSHWQEAETLLQKITDTRPNTELGDTIIQRRNTSMAYNCRIIENILAQNSDLRSKAGLEGGKKALIYAGIFHSGLEKKYKKDTHGLNAEVKKMAQGSVDFGFWFLKSLKDNPNPNISEAAALDFFVYATQEYSIPVSTIFDSDEYKNAECIQIPDSSRLILWGKLMNAYSNAVGEDKEIYEKLAKRLLKEDLVFFSPGERANYPEKQAMFDRMNQLKFNGQVEEGIDLSLFSDGTNPEGSRQILYISEGVPFFVNQMPDGSVV